MPFMHTLRPRPVCTVPTATCSHGSTLVYRYSTPRLRTRCSRAACSRETPDNDQGRPPAPVSVTLPIRMNTIPHPRPMRYFFYEDVTRAVMHALDDGILRMSVRFAGFSRKACSAEGEVGGKAPWHPCSTPARRGPGEKAGKPIS